MTTDDPFAAFKQMQKAGWASFTPLQAITTATAARLVNHARIRSGQRVLDVGCGTGLFLKSLAAGYDGLTLTGLDLSAHMLAQARQGAKSARSPAPVFVQGSVDEMPFADGAFDVALNCISCHFYLDQVQAFREIHRVLVPGGRFFCAALTAGLRGQWSMSGIATYYPAAALEDHFRQAGFEVVGVERMFPVVALFELSRPAQAGLRSPRTVP